MNLRQYLNQNPVLGTTGAIVVMVLCGVFVYWYTFSSTGPSGAYFLDLNTNKVFVGPVDQTPPIDTASGPDAGVLAFIYTCGNCSEFDGQTVEQVEETDAAVAFLRTTRNGQNRVRLPSNKDGPWISERSQKGLQLMAKGKPSCAEGQAARLCHP
jgi:hypothetical protein